MDTPDLALRNLTYGLFVGLGRAPSAEEVAKRAGTGEDDVVEGWSRLHDQHAVVLDAATGGLRMANPFSAVSTPHRVQANDRWWFANCAWDAFGICAALHTDGRIETSCPDCGQSLEIEFRAGRSDHESLLFHCLVAASSWWDDIVFT